MKTITYSLCCKEQDSNNYYKAVGAFADIVINEGLAITKFWITKLKLHIEERQLETTRSDEEYMLEILTIGVLWLRYSDDATEIEHIPKELFLNLVELRQKGGKLKLGADFMRGILGTFVLYSEHNSELVKQIEFNLDNFIKLVDWLSTTGEFIQETRRFKIWESYLWSESRDGVADFIAIAVYFAIWFEKNSLTYLGCYTENVEPYLENVKDKHLLREDLIFCSRQRLEYHLNMLGAEIMNRAYRKDFVKTKRKAVFLPACIRKHLNGTCKAGSKNEILFCSSCSDDCQVKAIKDLGNLYGYEVLIIPHESSAFKDGTFKDGDLGIIGIACIINLISGGWKAKAMGIPAQCVLLDYCGCKNHWDDIGFSTSINMEQLEKIMVVQKTGR
jgi:uncharacterized protein